MGTVIGFPEQGRIARDGRLIARPESATVIILPVIRIERYTEEPSYTASRSQRRRRRRRVSPNKTSD